MARKKTGDKLADIHRAAVAEVAQTGSSAVSVNTIAKRAGLAIGTVYRYHDSKESLLRSVYLTIKGQIHRELMAAAHSQSSSPQKIQTMWFAILDYAQQCPDDFIFAEIVMNAALLPQKDAAKTAAMTHMHPA